ncbi:hypothetical protein CEW46_21450 [Bacillus cereus]|nr:hypothetical protein CEW46_21450 [Bacillus cereus]
MSEKIEVKDIVTYDQFDDEFREDFAVYKIDERLIYLCTLEGYHHDTVHRGDYWQLEIIEKSAFDLSKLREFIYKSEVISKAEDGTPEVLLHKGKYYKLIPESEVIPEC